jgi:hypothetical protein
MLAGYQGNRKRVRGQSNIQCLNCKRTGHTKEQCWRKGGGAFGQGLKQKNKNQEQAHQASENSSDSPFDMVFNIFSSEEAPIETAATAGAGRKTPFTRYDWIMDSGTTSHIATEQSMFKDYEEYREELMIPGRKKVIMSGRGTIELECPIEDHTSNLVLLDVFHIPTNDFCLFSESRFDLGGGGFTGFQGERKLFNGQKKLIAEARLTPSRLYLLKAKAKLSQERINAVVPRKPSWDEWH